MINRGKRLLSREGVRFALSVALGFALVMLIQCAIPQNAGAATTMLTLPAPTTGGNGGIITWSDISVEVPGTFTADGQAAYIRYLRLTNAFVEIRLHSAASGGDPTAAGPNFSTPLLTMGTITFTRSTYAFTLSLPNYGDNAEPYTWTYNNAGGQTTQADAQAFYNNFPVGGTGTTITLNDAQTSSNRRPTISVSPPSVSTTSSTPTTFTATVGDPDGGTPTVSWTANGGSPRSGSGTSFTWTPPAQTSSVQTFTITAEARDSGGLTATASVSVTLEASATSQPSNVARMVVSDIADTNVVITVTSLAASLAYRLEVRNEFQQIVGAGYPRDSAQGELRTITGSGQSVVYNVTGLTASTRYTARLRVANSGFAGNIDETFTTTGLLTQFDGQTDFLFVVDDRRDVLVAHKIFNDAKNALLTAYNDGTRIECERGPGFGLNLTRPRGLAVVSGGLYIAESTTDKLYRVSPYDGCAYPVSAATTEFGQSVTAPRHLISCALGAWLVADEVDSRGRPGLRLLNVSTGVAEQLNTRVEDTDPFSISSIYAAACGAYPQFPATVVAFGPAGDTTNAVRFEGSLTSGTAFGTDAYTLDYFTGTPCFTFSGQPTAAVWVDKNSVKAWLVAFEGLTGRSELRYYNVHANGNICAMVTTTTPTFTGADYNAADGFGVGVQHIRGMAYFAPTARPPDGDPSTASSALLNPEPTQIYRPIIELRTVRLADGDLFTDQVPVIARSHLDRKTTDTTISILWEAVEYATSYEIEITAGDDTTIEPFTGQHLEYMEDVANTGIADMPIRSYRIRAVLTGGAEDVHYIETDHERLILPPNVKTTSPWSTAETVLLERPIISPEEREEEEAEIGRPSTIFGELTSVFVEPFGTDPDTADMLGILLFFAFCCLLTAICITIGGANPAGLLAGLLIGGGLLVLGGPYLAGIPWEFVALPGALLGVVAVMTLKARRVFG